MEKKKPLFFICFIILCLALCLIPSVGMFWFSSHETIGNETAVDPPSFSAQDGSFNTSVLSDAGNWFETHFAFRPQLITADAALQADLFEVSNTDSVIIGSDGWMFYRSTLNDYLGKEQLSERGMFNLAHNLSLIQNYVLSQGARFLFMVPPNKNSLYPQHMPYYYRGVSDAVRNRERLTDALAEAGVAYLDLFTLFDGQDEVLYLKQDSHWNNKGASMVYDRALSFLGKTHIVYESDEAAYLPSHEGDLLRMIRPAANILEEDYIYDLPGQYTYISNAASSDPVSVEDYRVETENPDAQGNLLMYRDSFCNTLIPFLAEEFAHTYFSKAVPYAVFRDMGEYHPDYVIIELVERNIRNLAVNPALTPAPQRNIDPKEMTAIPDAVVQVQPSRADISMTEFSGTLSADDVGEQGLIYLAIPLTGGKTLLYETFTVTADDNDYGFCMFLPQQITGPAQSFRTEEIRVFVKNAK